MNTPKIKLLFLFISIAFISYPLINSSLQKDPFLKNPVLFEGRVQPLDSVARNTLLVLNHKTTVKIKNNKVSYKQWFKTCIEGHPDANEAKLFYISSKQVKQFLKTDDNRLSFNDLQVFWPEIITQYNTAKTTDETNRSKFQKDIIDLYKKTELYLGIRYAFLVNPEHFQSDFKSYTTLLKKENIENNPDTLRTLASHLEKYDFLASSSLFYPIAPTYKKENWKTYGEAMIDIWRNKASSPYLNYYQTQLLNTSQIPLLNTFKEQNPSKSLKVKLEYYFNQSQIFYQLLIVYLGLFASLLFLQVKPNKKNISTIKTILTSTFILHTLGLCTRMWIQARPPITNLYSSAIFIGWISILICILLEKRIKNGLSLMVASITGFTTLIIAHHLLIQGDNLEQMQAVLDSNFWLTTHVITICIGYAGTFIASLFAAIIILKGVLTKLLTFEQVKKTCSLIYAMIAFSLFFSVIGTILGGIWADQSWGRFWGWDPKENGALLIVLFNAIILHAKWVGLIKQKGLLTLALTGTIVTSFSWFGVNMLNIGLHSYGFMEETLSWYIGINIAIIYIILLSLLPIKYWKSKLTF